MSLATERMGLLSAKEAATQLGVDPSTIRKWCERGHLVQTLVRDGSTVRAWYRADDVWACARQRLSPGQLKKIRDTWDEVDRVLAERAGQVSL